MTKTITVGNGLMEIEGDLSVTGVTLDMVKSIREAYSCLNDMVVAANAMDLEEQPDMEAARHRAEALLKFLRATALSEKKQAVSNGD